MDDIPVNGSDIRIGDNPVSLYHMIGRSGSVSDISMIYLDVELWCEEHCSGRWHWGWLGIAKDLINFPAHVCFDHTEDAVLFKLSFNA